MLDIHLNRCFNVNKMRNKIIPSNKIHRPVFSVSAGQVRLRAEPAPT